MTPPLFHTQITAQAAPDQWLFFLHGILGSGSNWRSFAKRLVTAHPTWGGALVDLRMHGKSQGFSGPHSVAAASRDLAVLASTLGAPVRGVLGHSFGGKVALAYAGAAPSLTNLFLLDSNPAPQVRGRGSELTLRVIAFLKSLPPELPSRQDFLHRVTGAGFELPLAQWLSMNLVARGASLALGVDLQAIETLLADYFRTDLFPVLEALPSTLRVDFIVGGASEVLDRETVGRVRALAEVHRQIHIEVLPGAGHWVHVDDPEGVFRAVSQALGKPLPSTPPRP